MRPLPICSNTRVNSQTLSDALSEPAVQASVQKFVNDSQTELLHLQATATGAFALRFSRRARSRHPSVFERRRPRARRAPPLPPDSACCRAARRRWRMTKATTARKLMEMRRRQ